MTPGAPTPDPVRLEYTGAATCADASTFRNLVASRMSGRDPFTVDAPKRLVITLRRGGPAWFAGTAAMFDATGKRRDHRELDAPNCTELAESMAFVVSVWMAPLVLPAAAPPEAPPLPPPPGPTPAPEPPELAPLPPTTKPPEVAPPALPPIPKRAPIAPRVGASARVEFASGARPAFGLTLDAGFRVGWFSLAVEFHWIPSVGTTLPNGANVSNRLLGGVIVACGHVGQRVVLAGCLLGEAGQSQRAPSTSTDATGHATSPYGGGGARALVEVLLASPVYLQAAADLLGVAAYRIRAYDTSAGAALARGGIVGGLVGGIGGASGPPGEVRAKVCNRTSLA